MTIGFLLDVFRAHAGDEADRRASSARPRSATCSTPSTTARQGPARGRRRARQPSLRSRTTTRPHRLPRWFALFEVGAIVVPLAPASATRHDEFRRIAQVEWRVTTGAPAAQEVARVMVTQVAGGDRVTRAVRRAPRRGPPGARALHLGLVRRAQGRAPRRRAPARQVQDAAASPAHGAVPALRSHWRVRHAAPGAVERVRRDRARRAHARRRVRSDRAPQGGGPARLAELPRAPAPRRGAPAPRSFVAALHHVRRRGHATGHAHAPPRRVPGREAAAKVRAHRARHAALALGGGRLAVGENRRRGIRDARRRRPPRDPRRLEHARLPERAIAVHRRRVVHDRRCGRSEGRRRTASSGARRT